METIYLLVLAGVIVLVLAAVVGIRVTFGSKKHKLRKLLQEMEKKVSSESVEMLKGKYVRAYDLYLRLSEKHKQNFYGRITKIREKMEEQLKAAKKVEELLQKSTVTDFSLLQRQYEEMYDYFKKLPASMQQKYYPQIMHVKEVLEKGR